MSDVESPLRQRLAAKFSELWPDQNIRLMVDVAIREVRTLDRVMLNAGVAVLQQPDTPERIGKGSGGAAGVVMDAYWAMIDASNVEADEEPTSHQAAQPPWLIP